MIFISNTIRGAKSSAKVYLALLNQTGANNPVVTVLNQNDTNFLGNLNWVRDSAGVFSCTNALFNYKKTIINGLNPFVEDTANDNTYTIVPSIATTSGNGIYANVVLSGNKAITKKITIKTLGPDFEPGDGKLEHYSAFVEIVVFD